MNEATTYKMSYTCSLCEVFYTMREKLRINERVAFFKHLTSEHGLVEWTGADVCRVSHSLYFEKEQAVMRALQMGKSCPRVSKA